jgi:hypothetical protein
MTSSAGAMPIIVFCKTYGIGRSKAYTLINSGAVSARKSGKSTLVDRASAEAWYAALPPYRDGPRITPSNSVSEDATHRR